MCGGATLPDDGSWRSSWGLSPYNILILAMRFEDILNPKIVLYCHRPQHLDARIATMCAFRFCSMQVFSHRYESMSIVALSLQVIDFCWKPLCDHAFSLNIAEHCYTTIMKLEDHCCTAVFFHRNAMKIVVLSWNINANRWTPSHCRSF